MGASLRLRVLWWGSLAASAALLLQPVGVQAQLLLSLALLAAMLAAMALGSGQPARFLVIGCAVFVTARYVGWRLTATLPPASDPVGLGFGLVLLGAELYCVAILVVSLVVNAEPLQREAPPAPQAVDAPTVDVFIPTYNESIDILATTVAAALRMDYPAGRVTVWLLDDGGTDQKCTDPDPARAAAARRRRRSLQALCRELGAVYLTRARNEHAKAGNLNNGLRHATGEIVVVFDADHAPFRQFLTETVGHFAQDPRLFLVQTPHVFLNPDPIERNLRTFDRMPSENEMFYALTQRGLDKWNGSFFCGSAALLRRAALESAGGFSGITITEDCETAFELHARGWTSVYTATPLIAGLQPETFESFIGQRSRWCQGMMQILLLKNPALKPGLRPIQRLAYLSSMIYWFFPLPRLVFMLAPLLYILFDVRLFVASLQETVAYTFTYLAASVALQNYLFGRLRWPWMSELYEYVQGLYLARAIASVVLSPRKPTFNVTAKGETLDRDHLSALAGPFAAMFVLLATGVAVAAWRYLNDPGVSELMLVAGGWCLFGAVLSGVGLGVVAERRQETPFHRLPVSREGWLSAGGTEVPVTIMAASGGDAVVQVAGGGALPPAGGPGLLKLDPLHPGERIAPLPVADIVTDASGATVLRWGEGVPAASLADLLYGDAAVLQRTLQGRRRHRHVLPATLRMMIWAVQGPLRAARLVFARKPDDPAAAAAAIPAPVAARGEIWDEPATLAGALARIAGGAASTSPGAHVPAKPRDAGPQASPEFWSQALARLVASGLVRPDGKPDPRSRVA